MSFCSSCGAQNSDDARFCNKCGTAMGAAAASAPISSGNTGAAPSPMGTGTSITLGGIGIQSPSKTYAILGGGALLFLALGAGIAWVGLHGGTPPPTTTTDGTAEASDTTGDAVPDGVDVPDDDFIMTSAGRVRRSASTGSGSGGATPPTTGTTDETRPTGGGTRPPTTTTGGTGHTTTGHTAPPPSTTTGGGHTGTTATDPPPSSGSTAPPTTGPAPDWDSLAGTTADPGEEPDLEMDMYSTQIRRFIRQNLLPQATSCFEHASATSRDPIHGTVAIGFDINARGHAEGATIDRNTTGNDALARCLQNNVNTWQLPPPPAGTAPIQMQMPFTR